MVPSNLRTVAVRSLAGFMLLLFAPYAMPPAAADSRGAEAEAFLVDLVDRGMAALKTDDRATADRDFAFGQLVREGFALNAIGQFVAGRHWRTMSADQRAEFQTLFAEWLLTAYARRLGGYDGQSVDIVNSLVLQNRARDVLVRTRIAAADGQLQMTADWRVRNFDGEIKIIDVVVENVSMALAQRAEIDSAIRRIGVDGLLEDLRSRLAVLVAETR